MDGHGQDGVAQHDGRDVPRLRPPVPGFPFPAVSLAVFLVSLAFPLAALAAAPSPECGSAAVADRLAVEGLPVVAVVPAGPIPGDVAILQAAAGSGVLLWFAVQSDGSLVTFAQPLASEPAERETWLGVAERAVEALDASAIRGCDGPRVAGLPPEAKAVVESLASGLNSRPVAGRPTSDPHVEASTLQAAVNVVAMALVVLYLVLVLGRAVVGARRRPLDAALAVGLVLLALVIRWTASDRVPIGVANGDLSHIADLEQWGRTGIGSVLGVTYPPAWRGLLYLLFQGFGPSLDLAFVLTTVTGAAVAAPVYLLARRLDGTRRTGILAGIAFAAYPTAVFFANGFGLEVPASALLILGFVHLLDWLDGGRPLDAVLYVLSMALLVQTRLEGLGMMPVLVAMHVAVIVRAAGGWRSVVRMVPWALVALAASLPFAWTVASQTLDAGDNAAKASRMLIPVAAFLALVVLSAIDSWRIVSPARRFRGEPVLRVALVLGALAWFLYVAVTSWPNSVLVPSNLHPAGLPYYEMHVTWPYGTVPDDRVYPEWLTMVGVFPLPFLVAWFLSLLPVGRSCASLQEPDADGSPAFPPLVFFLAVLPWFGHYLTRYIGTGIAAVEGMRHHVLFTGVAAVSVGLGAGIAARWLGRWIRLPRVALAVVAVVLLSPAATHRSYLADADFDSQREFRFARDSLSRLPQRALILVPDDLLDFGPDALIPPKEVHRVYRTRDLWVGVAWPDGRWFEVEALRVALAQGVPSDVPLFFYQGLECRRAVHPDTVLPSCRIAAEVLGRRAVATVRFPNRPYSAQSADRIGILGPEVELALYRMDADDLVEIGRRLAEATGGGGGQR